METITGKRTSFLSNDCAQVGAISYVLIMVFMIGFLYIILGGIMSAAVDKNNEMMDSDIAYSSARGDAMNVVFAYWYWFLAIVVIVIVVYAIWAGFNDQTGSSY